MQNLNNTQFFKVEKEPEMRDVYKRQGRYVYRFSAGTATG